MILVVGATGKLGGGIAQALLAQGKPVRVLLRRNSPAERMAGQGMATSPQSLIDAGAEPVYGDMKDRESLTPAMLDVETVITTANAALRGGEDSFTSVDDVGNRNLIDAAAAAGVPRFIFVSTLGAHPDSPNPLFAAKGKTEIYLRNSGLDHTILAPNLFIEVWVGMVIGMPLQAGEPVTLVRPATHRHSFISSRDVAAYAVAAVDNPAAVNRYLILGGPEALSWSDVVARASRVLGRELPVRLIEPGEPVPLLPPLLGQGLAAMETYDSVLDMTELSQEFGVTPTALENLLADMFRKP